MLPYAKTAKTYDEQVALLQSRGLIVSDVAFAVRCLTHHNYYRLSAYRYPLTVHGSPDQFLPGATFAQLWGLYEFDRALRQLVLEASKRVEVSVRSRWAYEVGHRHGPQAYEQSALFKSAPYHQKALLKLDEELSRSQEEFVAHFRSTYGMTRPPIWAACEIMTFGQVSNFYTLLADPRLRQVIADTYRLDERVLVSFLHHLNVVRNTCAHHARLWNRRFPVSLQPPRTKPAVLVSSFDPTPARTAANPQPQAPNKLYNTVVMLAYLMDIIHSEARWRHRVRDLVQAQSFPVAAHMGFPVDWSTRPIWAQTVAPMPPHSAGQTKTPGGLTT
jgi:abortive infection bacteriophage resistance protein